MRLGKGDIVLVDLGQRYKRSHIYNGIHPGVIISSEEYNRKLNAITICVMTSKGIDDNKYTNHIIIEPKDVKGHLQKKSMIIIESPAVIGRESILAKTGSLRGNEEIMDRINTELRNFLDLKEGMD